MKARIGRVVGALGVSAMLVTSMAVLAPAAQANSRCNTRDHTRDHTHDHTHGAGWWKRTDNFLGTSASRDTAHKDHHHSNSDPKTCPA